MNLLFAIDAHVVTQLMTVLYSVAVNSPDETIDVYVLQKHPLKQNQRLTAFCANLGMEYHPLIVGATDFDDAPTTNRYPETIYYRLLAQRYLPRALDRILYLDVDTLIINDLHHLYRTIMTSNRLYAAASHSSVGNYVSEPLNRVRLGNYEAEGYFNTGMLLMNLPAIRQQVHAQDIFDYIADKKLTLLLPDQDVMNGLYGHQIVGLPDELYNYDARMSAIYYAVGGGLWDLDWVIKHTVVLHFCGRDKPWRPDYKGRYAGLYKHYAHRAQLVTQ